MAVYQRLEQIIDDYLKIKSSDFAENVNFSKQAISGVVNGRSKPSFDLIAAIAQTYPAINLRWLVLGEGEMLLGEAVSPASAITLHGNGANNQNSIHSTLSASEREMALLRELLIEKERTIKVQESLIATLTPKGDTP